MKKIGLMAGWGDLPRAICIEARKMGNSIFVVGLEPLADESLREHADEIEFISVGKLGKVIKSFKKAGVKDVVLAGKVPKSLMYKSKIVPDLRAARFIMSLKDRKDDTILLALSDELGKDGLSLLETTAFTEGIMADEGVMTSVKPKKHHMKDIEFGLPIAKGIGGMDIGQSIVVKNKAVMAVEAIEGTDEAIIRGGELAGGDAVAIKVAKPGQDLRFDVPGIGKRTISSMSSAGVSVLAVEAGACIIIDKEDVLGKADELGISIVGIKA